MNYKLVVSDFDGTLLRRDDTISARTVDAIREFVSHGGKFVISTGRSYASIRKRLGELGISEHFPVMSCQGAISCDLMSGEVHIRIPIPLGGAEEFLRRVTNQGLIGQLYTGEEIYASHYDERNEEYFLKNRLTPTVKPDICKFVYECDKPLLKVLCLIPATERERLLGELSDIDGIKVFASHPNLIEAVSDKAGKENGLLATAESFGIPREQTVAIGDELNDLEMIRTAGLGVAMANAVDEVKKNADLVTADCDDDGVAAVLEKIVSGQL